MFYVKTIVLCCQVRAQLYKLRMTWGERFHVFTDLKLYQLDQKIKTIDPAWPVVSVAKDRQAAGGAKPTKIHVNPAFVGKVNEKLFDFIHVAIINY